MKTIILALLALGLLATSAHANLIKNGGFESGDLSDGWSHQTDGGVVSLLPFSDAPEGIWYFRGHSSNSDGTLSQSFNAIAGAEYSLFFYFGSTQPNPTNNLSVSVGDLDQALALTTGGTWFTLNSSFTATSAVETLLFSFSTVPGSGTVWLDDIRVEFLRLGDGGGVSVPEPGTLALLGLGLVGIGMRRRAAKAS